MISFEPNFCWMSRAVLPDIAPYPVEDNLSSIVLTPDEVKLILKALPIEKPTGPDGVIIAFYLH